LENVKVGSGKGTSATEALVLVFMVVGLNNHWKQPIGYFLVNKLSADTQAQLVNEAMTQLYDCGFCVRAVVCDGSHTNQATARALGCKFEEDEFIHFFQNPASGQNVYFLLDACHLITSISVSPLSAYV